MSNVRSFKKVTDEKLANLKTCWMKKRTFNKKQLGVRACNSWREDRLKDGETFNIDIFDANLGDLVNLSPAALNASLCRFIPEVTKCKDGGDYPGKTLYEMVVSIQKFLNQNNIPWKLLEDPQFLDVKTVLDNTLKERAQRNIGMIRKQAQLITFEHEDYLWSQGLLGEDTPDKLRETVLFLLGINLALRAGDKPVKPDRRLSH